MKIILNNPSHNGDVLFSSKIIEIFVKSNPIYEFIITAACSTVLFEHLINDKITLQVHPNPWVFDKFDKFNPQESTRSPHPSVKIGETISFVDYLHTQHTNIWSFYDGDIYINVWRIMVDENKNCMDLTDRIEFTKNVLVEIREKTKINVEFEANHYTELIPEIPQLDISFMESYINIMQPIYKNRIFFFNLIGRSGQEPFPDNFNDEYIHRLLTSNPESIIIVPDTCQIKHTRLISLMDNFNIQKEFSGRSLVLYANICNICDEVHFKNNGGSLFTLNIVNINNKKVKYYYLGDQDSHYNSIKNCYGLNVVN